MVLCLCPAKATWQRCGSADQRDATATWNNVTEGTPVLRAKKNLKNSSKYSNVYIESDLPYEVRVANENNRRLLKVLGRDKDYAVVSGRIVQRHSSSGSAAEEHTDRNDGRQTERTWGRNARNSSQRRGHGRQPRNY